MLKCALKVFFEKSTLRDLDHQGDQEQRDKELVLLSQGSDWVATADKSLEVLV